MLIELQTTTTRFLTLFANKIRAQPVCLTDPITQPLPFCNGPWFIDHLKVPHGSITQLEPGTVQLQQPISFAIVLAEALPVSGPAQTVPCLEPQPTFNFNLQATVDGAGVPTLTVTYAGTSLPLPDLNSEVQGFLGNLAAPTSTPIPIDSIGEVFGTSLVATAAGIAVDPSGDRIAIRVEFEGGEPAGDWNSFFAGQFKAHDSTHDWSVFLSADLIEASIKSRLNNALQGPISTGTFELTSGPDVSYFDAVVLPVFFATFDGNAIDACQCFWGKIDLGVTINTAIELSVPEADTIQMDVYLSWDLNDLETVCCAFTAAVFWGFVGTELLDEGKINWGEFLAGVAGGATFTTVFNAFIGGAHGEAGKYVDFPGWQKIDEGDDGAHYVTSVTNSDQLNQFGLTMTGLLALPDGVSFGGTQVTPNDLKEPRLKLEYSQFEWVLDECGTKTMLAEAGCYFLNFGFLPIHACKVEILSADPLHQFAPFLQWGDSGAGFSIPYAALVPDYFANPYPCQLRIITNGGVRVITFDPIPFISQEEVEAGEMKAMLEYPIKCKEYLAEDPFWNGGRFNPKWAPDPPWERVVQQWHAIVQGLTPGEKLTVATQGAPIAEIIANGDGHVELVANVPAQRGEQGLIELKRERGKPIAERKSVMIKQVPLQPLGKLSIGGRPLDICLVATAGGPTLALATTRGVSQYNVSMPGYGRRTAFRPVAGVRGLLSWGGQMITWGEHGLVGLGSAVTTPFDAPISAAAADDRLLLLSEERLSVLEREDRRFVRHDRVEGQHMALSHGVLATAAVGLITLYDARSFAQLGHIKLRDATALMPARFAGAKAAFFVANRVEGGSLVALWRRGDVSETARYFKTPILFKAATVASRLAAIETDGTVGIYGVGSAVTIQR
jgi:hypothetical protein